MASAGFQDRVFTFHIDGFLFHQDGGDRFEGNTEINILPVRDTSLYATGMIRTVLMCPLSLKKRSFRSEPRYKAASKPSPYSNPFTALIVNIACPNAACNFPNTGSPRPMGTPCATQVMTPPIVSPLDFTSAIKASIFSAVAGSGQRTAVSSALSKS